MQKKYFYDVIISKIFIKILKKIYKIIKQYFLKIYKTCIMKNTIYEYNNYNKLKEIFTKQIEKTFAKKKYSKKFVKCFLKFWTKFLDTVCNSEK